ncbi:hypothetical protein ACFFRR_004748 [Megaselia abdita]
MLEFLIGFVLFASSSLANHHELLKLMPVTELAVRLVDTPYIVRCEAASKELKFHWKNPVGEIITGDKGRVHIEQNEDASISLVFEPVSQSDKGDWTCEAADNSAHKSFTMNVKQKITFMDRETEFVVKEGKDATLLCEVKGDPEPQIQWFFKDVNVDFDKYPNKYKKLGDGMMVSKVHQNDSGEYACKAYQISQDLTNFETRKIFLRIEHKPVWMQKQHSHKQYAYMNGTTRMYCEAKAEPPPTFNWYKNKKHLHSGKNTVVISESPYLSILQIDVVNEGVFDTYKCKVNNSLGSIDRSILLVEGTKPPKPIHLALRGLNSNTFDVDVGSVRTSKNKTLMDVNGFRIQYISESDLRRVDGDWSEANTKDFPFEDGATFLINYLSPNTSYFMRAASKNIAGLSDWTNAENFTTRPKDEPTTPTNPAAIATTSLVAVVLSLLICLKSILN